LVGERFMTGVVNYDRKAPADHKPAGVSVATAHSCMGCEPPQSTHFVTENRAPQVGQVAPD